MRTLPFDVAQSGLGKHLSKVCTVRPLVRGPRRIRTFRYRVADAADGEARQIRRWEELNLGNSIVVQRTLSIIPVVERNERYIPSGGGTVEREILAFVV